MLPMPHTLWMAPPTNVGTVWGIGQHTFLPVYMYMDNEAYMEGDATWAAQQKTEEEQVQEVEAPEGYVEEEKHTHYIELVEPPPPFAPVDEEAAAWTIDDYDPATAPLLPPKESKEDIVRKQITALRGRIARGGDASVLMHYQKVVNDMEVSLKAETHTHYIELVEPPPPLAPVDEEAAAWTIDDYDPATAPLLPPKEGKEDIVRKQITALRGRIARGGDASVLMHYQKVVNDMEVSLKAGFCSNDFVRSTCGLQRGRKHSIDTLSDTSTVSPRYMSTGEITLDGMSSFGSDWSPLAERSSPKHVQNLRFFDTGDSDAESVTCDVVPKHKASSDTISGSEDENSVVEQVAKHISPKLMQEAVTHDIFPEIMPVKNTFIHFGNENCDFQRVLLTRSTSLP